MAKVLARRLENILPKVISPTQTEFVKDRYILENLLTCWEAMNWVKESKQDVTMLQLDFEKAYDRIEWIDVNMMMEVLGFPIYLCQMVKTLMKDVKACVEINGCKSEAFDLSRSIRQGRPLAPAIFVIATNVRYYLLRDYSISPVVKGVALPNGDDLSKCSIC